MAGLLESLERGEKSRLFPVLSESSKEGRALSILLSCIESVDEFGQALMSDMGVKIGPRTTIETFTEVSFGKQIDDKALRPDGLIIVRSKGKEWSALVEAKIGNAELNEEQLESYLDIAKKNGINALITISNQFAPLPTHHPVSVSSAARKKADLLHWSWMYILTEATLLLENDDVEDRDQKVILNEFKRFLSHKSAGVQSFTQMPAAWTDIVAEVQAGGAISINSNEAKEVMGAWHQEARDLSLILSRQLGSDVNIKTSRIHARDPNARMKADLQVLSDENKLKATLSVPHAAAPVEICVDLSRKSISVSMRLKAPEDKKSTKARTNWLLRQLSKSEPNGLHVRHYWPGRGPFSQDTLQELRDDPNKAGADRPNAIVTSFEVVLVREIGGRFSQRKNFINELEKIVPEFYEQAGQYLKAWQPSAPKLKEDRADTEAVSTDALQAEADRAAFEKQD